MGDWMGGLPTFFFTVGVADRETKSGCGRRTKDENN